MHFIYQFFQSKIPKNFNEEEKNLFLTRLLFAMDSSVNYFFFDGINITKINYVFTPPIKPIYKRQENSRIPIILSTFMSKKIEASRENFREEEIKEALFLVFGELTPFFNETIEKFKQKENINDNTFITDFFNSVNNYFPTNPSCQPFDFFELDSQEKKNTFLFEVGLKEEVILNKLFFQYLPCYYAQLYFPHLAQKFHNLLGNWALGPQS